MAGGTAFQEIRAGAGLKTKQPRFRQRNVGGAAVVRFRNKKSGNFSYQRYYGDARDGRYGGVAENTVRKGQIRSDKAR